MISIGVVANAAGAAVYYAKDNYYSGPEAESAGLWFGQGAAALGLTGGVDAQAFENVLAGRLPTGAEIVAPSGAQHRAALDLVFSMPKSAAVLALVGGDTRLMTALEAGTQATLGWIQANLIEARRFDPATGSQLPVRTGHMVAATFTHDLSRNRDPFAHVHAVIANATLRPDGAWRALRNDPLFEAQAVIASVFHADLRSRVEELGYTTRSAEVARHGQFEIEGVSREVNLAYSTRTAEIDAHLEAKGRSGTFAERELAALATRARKDPGSTRDADRAEWAERAAAIGFDPRPIIDAAKARAARGQTFWNVVTRGLRGAADKGLALVQAMGIAPRDHDPLVPERPGRLSPDDFVAAQAVAAGARHLSQNEAAFSRLDLVGASLALSGPVGVAAVEARIASLTERGLLIAGGDGKMITTQSAVDLEQQALRLIAEGKEQSSPVLAGPTGHVIQRVAREEGLRRLSPRQEAAASLILSAKDRFVGVQGVAGAGKTTTLLPVARIAEDHGHRVLALAVGSEIARKLGADLKVPSSSVDSFLSKHRALLDPSAPQHARERSSADLRGAVILVDEASTLSTRQAVDLLTLAKAADVTRLAQIGDHRQHGAVAAGKPFIVAQKAGMATAELTENVRAKSDLMKQVTKQLDASDVAGALESLKLYTKEVARGDLAAHAAAHWGQMPREVRDQTTLIGAGRRLTADMNAEAQSIRRHCGELEGKGLKHIILDRQSMSREEARTLGPYREGRIVEFRAELKSQGIAKGTVARVVGQAKDKVVLAASGDRQLVFTPAKLARNLTADAVSVYERRQILLHVGDRVRSTANDHKAGLLNSQQFTIEHIAENTVTLRLHDNRVVELGLAGLTMRKIDLAYATNAYAVQGLTTPNAIIAMDSREKLLASSRNLHVAVTRVADQVSLFLDSSEGLTRAVLQNPGHKTSALELFDDLISQRQAQEERDWKIHRGMGSLAEAKRDEFRLVPKKPDFEKERDYAKELTKHLGIEQMTKARGRDWDLSM